MGILRISPGWTPSVVENWPSLIWLSVRSVQRKQTKKCSLTQPICQNRCCCEFVASRMSPAGQVGIRFSASKFNLRRYFPLWHAAFVYISPSHLRLHTNTTHFALLLLFFLKSDSDYVMPLTHNKQHKHTFEHHYFYVIFYLLPYFGFFSFISTSRKTQNRHFERFFVVWFFSLLNFAQLFARITCFTAVGLIALDAVEFGC